MPKFDATSEKRPPVPPLADEGSTADASEAWRDVYFTRLAVKVTPLGPVNHLRVERYDGKEGIPWDDLQAIKNAILGADALAIEVYPPASDLVNERNMRHLFEVPRWAVDARWIPNLKGGAW